MGSYNKSLPTSAGLFWSILRLFWASAEAEDWKNLIFTDTSKSKATLLCGNLITLSRDAHGL